MKASDGEDERVALARSVGQNLVKLRKSRPLVQNITNFVSMDIVANALLAAGGSPAMVHAIEEIDDFGLLIGALVINIGTLSADWVASMEAAARGARSRNKPWVLDPVAAGVTTFRTQTVQRLLGYGPAVIRGNASEILATATALGLEAAKARGKGVDSGNTTEEAAEVASQLAMTLSCTVVATGAVDVVTDGHRTVKLANGSPLMAQVTAIGCSLSAITGAFCAVTDAFEAAVAAAALVGIAGELAAREATLPGSFRVGFIDRLASVDEADILTHLALA